MLFPLPKLALALGKAVRRLDPWRTVEDLAPGNAELRRQIGLRYLGSGCGIDTGELVITNGAMEALNLCLETVTRAGDLVAVESPTFYGALQALERLGLKAVEVATHPRTGVDVAALAAVLDRHPVKAWDKSGLVMHCSSFSKTLAPGYRVGWTAAGRFAKAVARRKLTSSLAAPLPSQEGLSAYLQQGGYDRHLRQLRLALAQDISLAPGHVSSADHRYRHHVRVNFGHPDNEGVEAALKKMGVMALRLVEGTDMSSKPDFGDTFL